MNFIPLKVSLDEGCISDFIRRYHFEEKDKSDILRLYRQIGPRVHAEFHYVTIENENGLADDTEECANDVSAVDAGKSVIVVVTLGQAFDEYQESLLAKGDIHRGYMLDCIGLELLWAAYDEIDSKIYERTGKYVGNYTFAGENKLPMTEVPRLMNQLGQKMITYNEAYALIPKKSVLFTAPLLTEKIQKYARCASCSNTKCAMRQSA